METFITITLGVTAFFLFLAALILSAKGVASSIVFKVIPFFIGVAALISFIYRIGIFGNGQ